MEPAFAKALKDAEDRLLGHIKASQEETMAQYEQRMFAAVGRHAAKIFWTLILAIFGAAGAWFQTKAQVEDKVSKDDFSSYQISHPDLSKRLEKVEAAKDDMLFWQVQKSRVDVEQDNRLNSLEKKQP